MEQSVPPLRHVLLIDDNPDDRFLAVRELRREYPDLDITEAINIEEFKAALQTGQFDLVITDYQLRWSTGLKILHQVKAYDRNMPVVMFTNTGTQEIAVEAMKAGLDDYVVKSPAHLIRLAQAVRSVWERTQTRNQAAQLQFQLQFTLDRLQIGTFRLSQTGKLLEANAAFLNLLELETFSEAQSYVEQNSQIFNVDYADSHTREREIQLQRSDNQPIWLLISATQHTVNQVPVIVGLIEDISARKEAEATIRQMNQQLEHRVQERTAQLEATNRELEAFTFSVSHDLRSPIRQINGFVQLLNQHLEKQSPDDTTLHYLDTIDALTGQAGRMIDSLLAYSRTGRTPMRLSWIDLNPLVQEIKQRIEMSLPDRDIQWQVQPLPTVWADLSLLQLIFQNLLDNAVKYTRPRSPAQIEIGSLDGDRKTTLFVRDNGIGFDMTYGDRLFDVFQRLHDNPQFEGTGIGLANVQRIVHRHGGQVWAEGAPEQGAIFYVSLPHPSASSPSANHSLG